MRQRLYYVVEEDKRKDVRNRNRNRAHGFIRLGEDGQKVWFPSTSTHQKADRIARVPVR